MRELLKDIKDNWLYYLGELIILLIIAGIVAFIVFVAFLIAISSI